MVTRRVRLPRVFRFTAPPRRPGAAGAGARAHRGGRDSWDSCATEAYKTSPMGMPLVVEDMSGSPPGHTCRLTLQLIGPRSWTDVPALLCYDAADPYAMR